MILEEIKKIEGCKEVYLSTDSENIKGKHIYDRLGFVNTNKKIYE